MLALIAQWWSLISISIRAHHECPRYQNDERALCLPRLLPNLLTADETAAIIEATETAARERNYTSSRHAHYATTDLPVAAVYADGGPRAEAARRVVDRALNATVAELIERCGASDPALHDGFVIKYTPTQQAGLRQHGDGGRYSATVALSRPQRTGVRVPRYAKLEPQTCALRKRFANETCNSNFPERTFAQERFSAQYPLLQYDEFCPRNCLGQSCDDVDEHLREKCVCSQACESVAASQVNDEYDFAGGGTRFSSLRDVVFSPERGGAVVHGARLNHGGENVTHGDRFVLAFFFDERLCQAAEKGGATDVLYTSLVIVLVLVPLLVWIACFADFEDERPKEKTM